MKEIKILYILNTQFSQPYHITTYIRNNLLKQNTIVLF